MTSDIATILKSYITPLPFVDKIGGIVKAVSFTNEGDKGIVKKTIPVDCSVTHRDCLAGKYTDLVPNDKYKSLFYFEDGGTRFIESNERDFTFESSLKLVGWLNLKKLGKTDCSVSALAIMNILKVIPTKHLNYGGVYSRIQIRPVGEDIKSPAIFGKYTYAEQVQFLMFPYDYFGLNFKVTFNISKACVIDWTNGEEEPC